MFAGSQIVTNKLIPRNSQKELIDEQNEDKTAENLANMSAIVPRSKRTIVAESSKEKLERKLLAHERKQERHVEQKELTQKMENLMGKVINESSLTKNEEKDLRNRLKTIVDKINKKSDKNDDRSSHSSDDTKLDPNEKSNSIKPKTQGAFLLWYDKSFTS